MTPFLLYIKKTTHVLSSFGFIKEYYYCGKLWLSFLKKWKNETNIIITKNQKTTTTCVVMVWYDTLYHNEITYMILSVLSQHASQ